MEHHKDNSSPAERTLSLAERGSTPICAACRPRAPSASRQLSGRGRKGPEAAQPGRETSCLQAQEPYLYVENHEGICAKT